METTWDCIVVGGGAAGLSAALVLGRARQRTLVVDAGSPSNLPAEGIGGLLGHEGRPPAELYATGREELAAYPTVELRAGTVEGGERLEGGFELELAGGGREMTRRVILATGMDYRPPELPGLRELWGRSVFHCPFCHGWEVRDQALAVLGGGDGGVHRAMLLREWSDDVVLLGNGPAELGDGDRERLAAAGIEVDERPVAGLVARGGSLAGIEFADGSLLERAGLLVPVTAAQQLRARDPTRGGDRRARAGCGGCRGGRPDVPHDLGGRLGRRRPERQASAGGGSDLCRIARRGRGGAGPRGRETRSDGAGRPGSPRGIEKPREVRGLSLAGL